MEEDTSTDESSINTETSSTQKVFRDGQIYILRGDKIYTVTGQKVK